MPISPEKRFATTTYLLLASTGFVFILFIWSILSYGGFVESFFLPTPTKTVETLFNLLVHEGFLGDIFSSVIRILLGFCTAAILAIPLGFLLGITKKIEALLEPLIAFVRYIPPSALIPLSILWLGIGNTQKGFIIFMSVFPYLAIMVADIVKSTPSDYIASSRMLGLSKWKTLSKVVWPNSLPRIWESLRILIGAAWTFVILAELIGATTGIGSVMIKAQRFLQTPKIFAAILVVGLLGLLTDYIFKIGYRHLFPWSEKTK